MAVLHRIRQGVRALFAFSQPVDYALAEQYLSPELMPIFRQMQRTEQLHTLNVLRAVLAQGAAPRDLAVAALLHDAGKARYPLRVWQKTLVVLVRKFLPKLYRRWRAGDPENIWQRPFVVRKQHPIWSAEMVEGKVSERALWLIRNHQGQAERHKDHPYFHLLKRLQQADDAN
jgi:hypothetical protein